MPPSPHPSISSLRPLNPVTSHNNNNNNGGLHAPVRATEDIEPFLQLTRLVVECESQQQFDLIIGPHKRFWFPCTSHFRLLLVVFGFSFFFFLSIFLAFHGFIDSTVEELTGNRERDRGSDTQQRDPGQESNSDPMQQGQSLCTWDACSTNWA